MPVIKTRHDRATSVYVRLNGMKMEHESVCVCKSWSVFVCIRACVCVCVSVQYRQGMSCKQTVAQGLMENCIVTAALAFDIRWCSLCQIQTKLLHCKCLLFWFIRFFDSVFNIVIVNLYSVLLNRSIECN